MLLRQTTIHWNKFRPLGKWLVVKEDPEQIVTAGGIFLTEKRPTAADVGYSAATVLKIGNQVEGYIGRSLTPGDKVCHRKYLADVIKFSIPHDDGTVVFVMKAEDIEGIVPEGLQIDAI